MRASLTQFLAVLLLVSHTVLAHAQSQDATAFYIANEGVMVIDGDTKILFDPLFPESYGQYLLVPDHMKAAMFAGEAPFDGVDAIFISHNHGDHFSPEEILALMKAQPEIQLYAPAQAVIAMRSEAGDPDDQVFERVNAVSLQYKESPVTLNMANLLVEAVRIPHSGWPTGRVDVENIVWRVTLNGSTTVLHMGDADPNDVHFENDAAYWEQRTPNLAFPPYWFYSSTSGRQILSDRIKASRSVGIHVPTTIPSDPIRRPQELRGHDIFTQPGETRTIRAN
jgi:L-ascorbate metabolism protein UlaG (beta-lactamase superfamily)